MHREATIIMRHAVLLSFLTLFVLIEALHAGDAHLSNNQTGKITVQLAGFANDQGTVKLCLCRSEDEQQGKIEEFYRAVTENKNRSASWVFENIPYGRYSIKTFHDENGNNKLDTNSTGMPTERYGFSNNARGRFGPPSFASTAFTLNSPQMTIAIELK